MIIIKRKVNIPYNSVYISTFMVVLFQHNENDLSW